MFEKNKRNGIFLKGAGVGLQFRQLFEIGLKLTGSGIRI